MDRIDKGGKDPGARQDGDHEEAFDQAGQAGVLLGVGMQQSDGGVDRDLDQGEGDADDQEQHLSRVEARRQAHAQARRGDRQQGDDQGAAIPHPRYEAGDDEADRGDRQIFARFEDRALGLGDVKAEDRLQDDCADAVQQYGVDHVDHDQGEGGAGGRSGTVHACASAARSG